MNDLRPAVRRGPLFDDAGPPDAPALVLVHGSVVTRTMWLPQLRSLSAVPDLPLHVIAPDLPGHGALAGVPFSFDASARSLAELVEREAGGRAIVAGLSLGGYVAIELAHRRPDLVSGLVLSGCSVDLDGVLGVYLRVIGGLMKRGFLAQSRERAEEKTRRMFPPELADVADEQIRAGVHPESLGPALSEMAGRRFSALLATFPGPTVIANGERDSAARRGEREFLRATRNGRSRVVEGAGHACNLDRPAAYDLTVLDLARSLRSRGGQSSGPSNATGT